MSDLVISLAQFFNILWPILSVIVIFTMYKGPGGLRGFWKRIRRGLLAAWVVFIVIWAIAQFGTKPLLNIIPEPANTLLFFGIFFVLVFSETFPWLRDRLRSRRKIRNVHAIQDLKVLDPYQFEELVAVTYRGLGFWVQRVGKSGDHGVDLVMRTLDGRKWIVQCKRYRDSVGEGIIRELYGTLHNEKADRAILVTSAEITPPAEKWARGKPIDLVDGQALLQLMDRARRRAEGNLFQRWLRSLQTWLIPQPKTMPICPHHRVPLVLREPRITDPPGRFLYRCSLYPQCRVVLEQKDLAQNHLTHRLSIRQPVQPRDIIMQ